MMARVSAGDYAQKIDFYHGLARSEPVVIMADGQDDAVLISAEEYSRLVRRQRRPLLIEDLPDEDWRAIEAARDANAAEAGRERT